MASVKQSAQDSAARVVIGLVKKFLPGSKTILFPLYHTEVKENIFKESLVLGYLLQIKQEIILKNAFTIYKVTNLEENETTLIPQVWLKLKREKKAPKLEVFLVIFKGKHKYLISESRPFSKAKLFQNMLCFWC